MPIIEITSLDHPGVEIFSSLTEAQLRNRLDPGRGLFIAESPKVIRVALQASYQPLALLCEAKHLQGDAADLLPLCGDLPIYTGPRELLSQLTGYTLDGRSRLCSTCSEADSHKTSRVSSLRRRQNRFCDEISS